jgi:hypothetical protein
VEARQVGRFFSLVMMSWPRNELRFHSFGDTIRANDVPRRSTVRIVLSSHTKHSAKPWRSKGTNSGSICSGWRLKPHLIGRIHAGRPPARSSIASAEADARPKAIQARPRSPASWKRSLEKDLGLERKPCNWASEFRCCL